MKALDLNQPIENNKQTNKSIEKKNEINKYEQGRAMKSKRKKKMTKG